MKRFSSYRFFSLFLLLVLLSLLLPSGLWFFLPQSSFSYSEVSEKGVSDSPSPYSWFFLNRKSLYHGLDAGIPPDILLIEERPSLSASAETAELQADRIKALSLQSGLTIVDGHSLSESAHPVYRTLLEDFLRIKPSGWSFRYNRNHRTPDGRILPALIFSHISGKVFQLEGKALFSGKPPRVELDGQVAELYQWVPVFITPPGSLVKGHAELNLTEKGKALLREEGIPEDIPLLIELTSPLGRVAVTPLDMTSASVHPGRFKMKFKSWYMKHIALFRSESEEQFYWRIFIPWMSELYSSMIDSPSLPSASPVISYRFQTEESGFIKSFNNGDPEPFFVKGVNLGAALPGKWFTEFPKDEHLYLKWFSNMKEMHFNSLRLYTLLPPSFYRAFRLFNETRPEDPLFLIQEIWPEEHPPENNYWGDPYNRDYLNEIRLSLDALHGNKDIPVRAGRAWGSYTADISPWVMAYLIGREMEPYEVLATNRLNPAKTYSGTFLSALQGPATEAWLASCCDAAVQYEQSRYFESHPVGIVSWPTLDSQVHPSEWTDPELNGRAPFNDKAVVSINRIEMTGSDFGGFFGAYHIYPNYPDFMNNQSSYSTYNDSVGSFRYGGYLKEFIEEHTKYPALVAEYGISTSMATAHFNPDGYHHGGLSEEKQASGIIRMSKAIRNEGYAGTVIFEWIDEWAKKTWTTEPLMIPYDRHALWHNVLDPEQNYGLIAMKADSRRGEIRYNSADGMVSSSLWGDESYLTVELCFGGSGEIPDSIQLGIDSYDRERGVRQFSLEDWTGPSGNEFLVNINTISETARVLSVESYNLTNMRFSSEPGESQPFLPITQLVNRAYQDEQSRLVAPQATELGLLHWGPLDEVYNSVSLVGRTLTIRLPWGLLNVSDPSSGTVLNDDRQFFSLPERDGIHTIHSNSLAVSGILKWTGQERWVTFPDTDSLLLYSWP